MKTTIKQVFHFTFVIFYFSLTINAQGENNRWHFGEQIAIDFNNNIPIVSGNSGMTQREGSASVSDQNGNLLFYTNGVEVWNQIHQVMPNGTGLLGNESSTQSAIIVPKPGDSNIYYIFTTDARAGGLNNGLRYSVIDMSLDGGLGDITTEKNTLLLQRSAEKLSSTIHCNGQDIWVAAVDYPNSPLTTNCQFYCYPITNMGIGAPIVSSAGIPLESSGNTAGGIKFSRDGKRLCMSMRFKGLFLYDFNTATGEVFNLLPLFTSTVNLARFYGIEFSKNGNVLYCSEWNTIIQYNLLAGSLTAIRNSKTVVGSLPTGQEYGTLQLGPDNQIYAGNNVRTIYPNSMSTIESPDSLGASCSFNGNIITLSNSSTGYGLPQYVVVPKNNIQLHIDTLICPGSPMVLDARSNGSYLWSTGDTGQTVSINSVGSYWVDILTNSGCPIRDSINVTGFQDSPNIGNDTSICSAQFELNTQGQFSSYEWSTGETTQAITIDSTGVYWLRVTQDNCSNRDTIHVENIQPFVELGNDTILCPGTTLLLNGTSPNSDYFWQDNSFDSNYLVAEEGLYWIEASNICGEVTDTVKIDYYPSLSLDLGNDTIVCKDETIALNATSDGANTFQWQDNSSSSIYHVSEPGKYKVDVSNSCETISDSISIDFEQCFCKLFIPNAFTPNGDFANNTFRPITHCDLSKYNLTIYDRWGQQIFQTTNPNDAWDGTYQGQELAAGVYIYNLAYRFEGITSSTKQGSLVLIP